MDYIEIFPETTITEWPGSYDHDGVHVYSITIQKLPVVLGEKYTVEWDGVKYECVGYTFADDVVLGDISFYDERDNEGNGEPFAIWTYPHKDFAYIDTIFEGNHTVCVYQGTKPEPEEPTEPISFIEYLVNPKYHMGKPFRGFIGWLVGRRLAGMRK